MAKKKKSLSEMTLKELQAEAKKQKVKVPSKATKATLIGLLTRPATSAAPVTTQEEETTTVAASAETETTVSQIQTGVKNDYSVPVDAVATHDESEARKSRRSEAMGYREGQ